MILYGAGGHARVLLDCLLSVGENIPLIFDDDPEKTQLMGIEVHNHYSGIMHQYDKIIIAIGDNRTRKKISEKIEHRPGSLSHSSAIISPFAYIGEGTVVLQGAIVQAGAVIGRHVIINTGAMIDHDCIIGDYTHVGPGSVICGGVKIDEGVLIGAGAVVKPSIEIGSWSILGAGAVVVKNVIRQAVVAGNPAKALK
ncbi:MAG: acetyltransferase [Cyclobacteriaceae bacterium]|nr:acetyltransferase [Cyclobacteriaceae bacterium]